MSYFSEEALNLGRIQKEFESIPNAALSDLLRLCSRERVPYDSFIYLERTLITAGAGQ